MKQFAHLIKQLDSTNKTNVKVSALTDYFQQANDHDKLWTIAILSHRRPPRPVNTTLLRQYASELANIPLWLFEESYHIVGDLAESIALVIPPTQTEARKSLSFYLEELIELKNKPEEEKKAYLIANWMQMGYYERFVFTKLLTGGFRIGISQKLMTRALAKAIGQDENILAYKLMGNWTPQTTTFEELILSNDQKDAFSKPYPFYLAYAMEGDISELGEAGDWSAEHKWDGIRSQVIARNNEVFVWSRGEELITDKFPELQSLRDYVPTGTVLDGELLPFIDGDIGSFNDLQTRIGRKNVSKKILQKVSVILKAYDLLELNGKDIRELPYIERRRLLEELHKEQGNQLFQLSERLKCKSWEEVALLRKNARGHKSEGLMIKRNNSSYQVGRKKGDWWKWKVDPFTIDAVLTYAMRGHGRRSNLFTDYTFGLWQENENGDKELVTFAKAYSGLTDEEFRQVDAFIKRNTLERFGPVRSVVPQLVFEIAFEGLALSSRHKSGIAVRFPRIHRWRHDKKIEEANTVEDLMNLLN